VYSKAKPIPEHQSTYPSTMETKILCRVKPTEGQHTQNKGAFALGVRDFRVESPDTMLAI
jgi:hypothetical protein